MGRGYGYGGNYVSGNGGQKLLGFAALCFVYPIFCLILWILKVSTPAKTTFIDGGEIDNTPSYWIANTAYDHLISPAVLTVSLALGVFFVWLYNKTK
ncbi:hypothetical protein M3194_15670 [Paenibacillus glycanilyticus]|uniref:hypothetical protein n=1 Tax=Paenibacillus glycanilyticus TaxID=126569 RepID=UPI00203F9335|nr:hypothetical protein [Paenibacillus glycanilyticus]MCM3628782.1 hypothetical protein [Paenibacillus glycanilyticus]